MPISCKGSFYSDSGNSFQKGRDEQLDENEKRVPGTKQYEHDHRSKTVTKPQEQVIGKQRMLNILAVVIVVLFMTLLCILYRGNNRKKFVSQPLDKKKTLGTVKQHMATLQGLCNIGLRNGNGSPTENHFRQLATGSCNHHCLSGAGQYSQYKGLIMIDDNSVLSIIRTLAFRWGILIALTLTLSITASAQRQKADSLKALLPGKTDLERADIFYELAYAYGELDYRLAANYCDRSFHFAKLSGDSLRIVKAARIKASIFRRLEKMDSSICLGLEMLPIASRNHYHSEVKKILRGLSVANIFKANYDLGLQYNFELLRMTEQDHDSSEQQFALNNIGLIYYKLSDHKKALHYFLRALDANTSEGREQTKLLLNLSLCYSHLQDFLQAREYLRKSFDYSQSNGLIIEGLDARGTFYYFKGDLDSAETDYLHSYLLAKRANSERYQLMLAFELASTYIKRNQDQQARRYLYEAKSLTQKTAFKYEKLALYSQLAMLPERRGDQRKRVFHQEQYIYYYDSLYNRTMMNNVTKIESEFLERRNKNRITAQDQLLELHDQVIMRKRLLNILAAVIAALLMMLLYILYRSNNQKRFVNQLLDQKVKERTEMLEASCLMTKQMVDTHDAGVAKVLRDVKQQMATLSGLCDVGLKDGNGSLTEKHLRQIALVQKNVFEALDKNTAYTY